MMNKKQKALSLFFCIVVIGALLLFGYLIKHNSTIENGKTFSEMVISENNDSIYVIHPFLSADGDYIVVLPTHWNKENLRAKCSISSVSIGETIIGKEWTPLAIKTEQPIKITGTKQKKIIFYQTQLPSIFIHTESGTLDSIIQDKVYKESGTIKVVDANGRIDYEGKLASIHGRGNHTWTLPKKPFSIKLNSSKRILGLNKDKNFKLLSNSFDKSHIRNWLGLNLQHQANVPYHINCVHTNLFVNDEYQGLYLLTESDKTDNRGIKLADLYKANKEAHADCLEDDYEEETENNLSIIKGYKSSVNPQDITGGYFFEINYRNLCYDDDKNGFALDKHRLISIRKPEKATIDEVKYLRKHYLEIESAILQPDGINPNTNRHYSDYIDLDSYLNHYFMNELLYNAHGEISSFKQYKNIDEIDPLVYAAPAWDFDKALGLQLIVMSNNPNTLFEIATSDEDYRYNSFVCQLVKRPDFYQMAKEYYVKNLSNTINNWLLSPTLYDSLQTVLSNDAQLDLLRWKPGVNFSSEIQKVKDFALTHGRLVNDAFAEDKYEKACKVTINFTVSDQSSPNFVHTLLYLIDRDTKLPIEDFKNQKYFFNTHYKRIIDSETGFDFDIDSPISKDYHLIVQIENNTIIDKICNKVKSTLLH